MRASDQWVVTEELASGRPVLQPAPPVSVPGGAFINGVWQRDNLTLPVTDPEDGRLLAYVADSTPADVAAAVSGVQESVSTDDWPLWARSECLHEAARLLAQDAGRFAHLIASEGVKTFAEAKSEVQRADFAMVSRRTRSARSSSTARHSACPANRMHTKTGRRSRRTT